MLTFQLPEPARELLANLRGDVIRNVLLPLSFHGRTDLPLNRVEINKHGVGWLRFIAERAGKFEISWAEATNPALKYPIACLAVDEWTSSEGPSRWPGGPPVTWQSASLLGVELPTPLISNVTVRQSIDEAILQSDTLSEVVVDSAIELRFVTGSSWRFDIAWSITALRVQGW